MAKLGLIQLPRIALLLLIFVISCNSKATLISKPRIGLEFQIPKAWDIVSETHDSISIEYTDNEQKLLQINIEESFSIENLDERNTNLLEVLNNKIETISQNYNSDGFELSRLPYMIENSVLPGAIAEIYVQDLGRITDYTITFMIFPCDGKVFLVEATELGIPTQFSSELGELASSFTCLE